MKKKKRTTFDLKILKEKLIAKYQIKNSNFKSQYEKQTNPEESKKTCDIYMNSICNLLECKKNDQKIKKFLAYTERHTSKDKVDKSVLILLIFQFVLDYKLTIHNHHIFSNDDKTTRKMKQLLKALEWFQMTVHTHIKKEQSLLPKSVKATFNDFPVIQKATDEIKNQLNFIEKQPKTKGPKPKKSHHELILTIFIYLIHDCKLTNKEAFGLVAELVNLLIPDSVYHWEERLKKDFLSAAREASKRPVLA